MTWGQTSADRWLLTRYVTVENVGTYAAAVQVGALPFAILASFLSLFAQPILYKRADAGRKDVPAWIMIEGAVYALLAGAGLLVMTTQTEALVRFFLGRPQWSCAPLVPLVAAGSAVFRWSEVFLVGILVSGRTGLLIIPNLLGGAGAVAANLLLLPRMGVPGAAWALVVSSGLRLVALFEANRRAWHLPAPRSSQTPNESAHDVRGSHDAS
jgi:O-antigen/teichoic acid export membrane protein